MVQEKQTEIKPYRVEQNKTGTWAVIEEWGYGTVRSPFATSEEAVKREEEIASYYDWEVVRLGC